MVNVKTDLDTVRFEMTNSENYLFVYGTLRINSASPMSEYLMRNANFVSAGFLQGELYDLGSYPAAVLSGYCEDRVQGDVFLLRHAERIFAVLDDYEECGPGYRQPHEYIRTLVEITMPDGSSIAAWTYLYNRPITRLKRIVTGDYLQFLNALSKHS